MSQLARRLLPEWRRLFDDVNVLVVGVSGGPDSQALLDLIGELRGDLGFDRVVAVGIDHGLRPEARAELAHAEALARHWGIDFETIAVTLGAGGNRMEEARKVRYRAFDKVAARFTDARVAVGHIADDQVETLLHRLVRGSGLRGVLGMAKRRGLVVRPLLGITRAEILTHLQRRNIPYADDPTNTDRRYTRAVLRHDVIPHLRRINPRLTTAIQRFRRNARDDEMLLQRMTRAEMQTRLAVLGSLRLAGVDALAPALRRRMLRLWLATVDVRAEERHISALEGMALRAAGSVSIGGRDFLALQGYLWAPRDPADYVLDITVGRRLVLPGLNLALYASQRDAVAKGESLRKTADARRGVAFAADNLHVEDLRVRPWKRGDILQPFGQHGHIKVSDLFINAKIPRPLRPHWPLVVSGEKALWVIGMRRSANAPVEAWTERVLTLTIEGALPWEAS